MSRLVWTSLMSEVMEPFCTALTEYLTNQHELCLSFTEDESFAHRRKMVLHQEVDLAWICGVDYVTDMGRRDGFTDVEDCPYGPLVSVCYNGSAKPLYRSDMIVRADSPFQTFADLRDTVWAYNEIESFSGYKIMLGHLAELGEAGPFFRKKVKSGSHLNSLAMVAQGQVESAAIDSSVVQMVQSTEPELFSRLRIINSLGPYPMPPLVISKRYPPELRKRLEMALTSMHRTGSGSELLKRYQLSHFAPVNDEYYDPIRTCLSQSTHVVL